MTDNTATGRVKATALFNRINGAYVTVVSETLENSQYDKNYYEAREVDYLFGSDQIVGGLILNEKTGTFTDDFKVVPAEEQIPVVTEAQMNAMAAEKITSRYPVANQVGILANAVLKLGSDHKLSKTPEFEALSEMMDYINYCLQVNKVKKEHYRNDPSIAYESDDQYAARISKSMEGGVHEALGPRHISGGRVFS